LFIGAKLSLSVFAFRLSVLSCKKIIALLGTPCTVKQLLPRFAGDSQLVDDNFKKTYKNKAG